MIVIVSHSWASKAVHPPKDQDADFPLLGLARSYDVASDTFFHIYLQNKSGKPYNANLIKFIFLPPIFMIICTIFVPTHFSRTQAASMLLWSGRP